MCRVRCFFCLPGHMLAPSKEFLRGFVPQNPIPSCLPPPTSLPNGDPGSGVFPDSDPWEGTEEIKSFPPQLPLCAPPTPAKHVYPPWPMSDEARALVGFPARGREEIRSSLGCLGTFPTGPGRISLSGNMFLHVDVCFPMQTAPFPPAFPRGPPDLRPST